MKLDRGELWVVAQVALLIVHSSLALRFATLSWSVPSVCGILVLVLGLVLFAVALKQLGENLTPNPRPLDHAQLVTSGLYSVVRHPIYLSLILLSFGLTLATQSLPSVVTALFVLGFFHLKANREERWLVEKYPEYRDYAARVKKLIPWVF
jgi:protein-S-isoprenylcysteine O-methyltransferase Ste14